MPTTNSHGASCLPHRIGTWNAHTAAASAERDEHAVPREVVRTSGSRCCALASAIAIDDE